MLRESLLYASFPLSRSPVKYTLNAIWQSCWARRDPRHTRLVLFRSMPCAALHGWSGTRSDATQWHARPEQSRASPILLAWQPQRSGCDKTCCRYTLHLVFRLLAGDIVITNRWGRTQNWRLMEVPTRFVCAAGYLLCEHKWRKWLIPTPPPFVPTVGINSFLYLPIVLQSENSWTRAKHAKLFFYHITINCKWLYCVY